MMHSSTIAGSTPARRTASATTSAPSCGAVTPFSAPRNLPVGVRTALTITDSRISPSRMLCVPLRFHGDPRDGVLPEQRLEPRQDHAARTLHFARPLRADHFDDEH